MTHGLLLSIGYFCCLVGTGAIVTIAGEEPGGDLFEQPYVYLLRGDENFGKLAPNYSFTVPTPDSMFVAESRPLSQKAADSAVDAPQCFSLTLKRSMALRIVFADSTGTGMVAYEFDDLPTGSYTLGVKAWPPKLLELLSGRTALNVYFVADTRYQCRFRFDVNPAGRLMRTARTQFPAKR